MIRSKARQASKPAKQMDGYTVKPRAAAVAMRDTRARLVVPLPKGPTAKTGKRQPTAEERRWMAAIVEFGCIACRIDGRGFVLAAVHHMLRGGVRLGHLYTLPLCDPGHHQNSPDERISRHPWKARFEAKYGREDVLLKSLQERLA